jgi:uncharacterized coiled-coil protein SlyX
LGKVAVDEDVLAQLQTAVEQLRAHVEILYLLLKKLRGEQS